MKGLQWVWFGFVKLGMEPPHLRLQLVRSHHDIYGTWPHFGRQEPLSQAFQTRIMGQQRCCGMLSPKCFHHSFYPKVFVMFYANSPCLLWLGRCSAADTEIGSQKRRAQAPRLTIHKLHGPESSCHHASLPSFSAPAPSWWEVSQDEVHESSL